jgi:hypothetical protein
MTRALVAGEETVLLGGGAQPDRRAEDIAVRLADAPGRAAVLEPVDGDADRRRGRARRDRRAR